MRDGSWLGPYDMTLRFWSTNVPMGPIVQDLGLVVGSLQRRGEPIIRSKARPRRIAPKHFASVAHARTSDEGDVPPWVSHTLERIEGRPALVDLLRSGAVEALLWIAVLGHDPTPPPLVVEASLAGSATRVGAKIMVEDYNRHDAGGVPMKAWFG